MGSCHDTAAEIAHALGEARPPEMRVAAGANGSATSTMTTETQRLEEANARHHSNPPATIKIVLEAINRRGRSSASLPGTVLVASSRQPFLDAARVLIAAGYDPGCCLEGFRAGAKTFALRARLGIAAGLVVDETRTVFAKWNPFSLSAVAASIDHSEIPATTLAATPSALLQPTPDRSSSNQETERNHSAPPR
jgi:hypothetical protein